MVLVTWHGNYVSVERDDGYENESHLIKCTEPSSDNSCVCTCDSCIKINTCVCTQCRCNRK
jgi:hypothetical protein